MILFSIQPALASDFFEEPCQEDLSKVVKHEVGMFDLQTEFYPYQPNLRARKFGVTHALCIDELIRRAKKIDMSRLPLAQKYFVTELEWVRDLFKGDMGELYRQAKYYSAQNDKGHASSIGLYLRIWATDHKYAPAEFNRAQGYETSDGEFSEFFFRGLPERGCMPAILEAARRLMTGDGLDKDRGEAWYWLKRAQQKNVDTSFITQKSLNQLLEEMNERERWSLAHFAHYHDDLDLTDINIPPSFRPLTDKIPDPLSDQEVAMFAKKFKGLPQRTNNKTYISVERELVTRTAGIPYWEIVAIDGQIRPLGMNNDEFIHRKCNYHRAIDKIFPQSRGLNGELLRRRDDALASLFQKDAARYINDVLQTGQICPNPESKRILEALAWARELDKMAPSDLRELAAKHYIKSGSSRADRYRPDPDATTPENEFKLFMHYLLAKTIRKFTVYKELKP